MAKPYQNLFYILILLSSSICLKYELKDNEALKIGINHKDNLSELSDTQENILEIKVEEMQQGEMPIIIGKKGIIYFSTDYNDQKNKIFISSDIEEKTSFNSTVFDEDNNQHNINCRFFNPANVNIRIFCKVDENGEEYGSKITTFLNSSFIYDNYKIILYSESLNINIIKADFSIPFLYSDQQIINIDLNNKEQKVSLKFKYDSYNNETLLIFGQTIEFKALNECRIESKEIICKINQEILADIMLDKNDFFMLMYYTEFIIPVYFVNVLGIQINIIEYYKENIFVKITKLLENTYKKNNYIAYETNVTNISNIKSLDFYLKENLKCFFKKHTSTPLLMLCSTDNNDEFYLGEIEKERIFEDINAKYTFIILPVINYELFKINDVDNNIYFSNPSLINFNLYDEIEIDIIKQKPNVLKNIRLNHYSDDLICENINDYLTRCTAHKNHFENQISGYFFTYHKTEFENLNKYSIYYELSPIQVILPFDNKIYLRIKKENNLESIKIGKEGILYFTTNYNDYERNIFDANDISFKSKIIDEEKNEYDANCKLWKPIDEKIKIFCELKENLKYSKQNITLNQISFNYKDYIINIIQEEYLSVEQLNYEISFLYSNAYTIYLYDNNQTYNFQFNIETYKSNDILYIYGQKNNYAVLDNCEMIDGKLNCIITKQKLEGILVLNKEKFNIGIMNDNIGIIECNCILDIIVYYENIKKAKLYILLTKELGTFSEKGNSFGYETNVTNIPDLISDTFYYDLYFKKIPGKNLILFIIYNYEKEDYRLDYFNTETEIENKHYKYNFIIKPFEAQKNILIKGSGTDIKLVYPEQFDFTKKDSFIIRYIMTSPKDSLGIKLNPDASELNCVNLIGIKKCSISLTHFSGKEFNSYPIYHYNNDFGGDIIYQDSPFINVKLPNNIIEINILNTPKGIILGKNGSFSLVTDYYDNETNVFDISDIEEKTEFNNAIIDQEQNRYDIICNLWKPTNHSIIILCKLNTNQNIKNNYIKFNDFVLHYKEYTINIISLRDFISLKEIESTIPLLYSDVQIINIEKEIISYELNFKIFEYNKEPLILINKENNLYYIILDKCNTDNQKNLICEIEKEKFEELLYDNTQIFFLSYYNEFIQNQKFDFVFDIIINYNIEQKENINVKIMSLYNINNNNIYKNNYIAYETDITNINDIKSKIFYNISFGQLTSISCLFKKTTDHPLLLICLLQEEGTYSLNEINSEVLLDKISVKYNFIIQPVKNSEEFIVQNEGNSVIFFYPTVLDFYSSEKIYIDLNIKGNSYLIKFIKLNPDSEDLICNDTFNENNQIISKKCFVSRSHFAGKKSGNYYFYYLNYYNKPVIFYELSPVNVILPPENEIFLRIKKGNNNKKIMIGNKGIIYFVTDYDDIKKNIFNNTDMVFKTKLIDENKYEYEVECKFWKPTSDNLRIFCKLNKNLKYLEQNIILNKTTLYLYDYIVNIIQEDYILIEQCNYNLPFLYLDKKTLNFSPVSDNAIEFNIESYSNEILYIHGQNNNYFIMDNCQLSKNKNKTLSCSLDMEQKLKLIVYNMEKFKVGVVQNNLGLIPLDNILDIHINITFRFYISLYVGIKKLININTEIGAYYAYETNNSISTNFITGNIGGIFDSCFFKQTNGKPLYIFCKSNEEYNGPLTKSLNKEVIYYNTHYIYYFRIQPFKIDEILNIKGQGTDVKLIYPENIDFTKNDTFNIIYIMTDPTLSKNIKLGSDSPNLNCNNKNQMKICSITKDYFIGKYNSSDNYKAYDTFYPNHDGELVKYNEISDIKVLLPIEKLIEILVLDNDNNKEINVGENGIIYFFTNYMDIDNEIFDKNDIEEQTEYKATISDKNYNDYNVTCRLWKPLDDKLRIFCKLNVNIIQQNTYIKLNSASFNYKEHKIAIISKMDYSVKINAFNTIIPFVYSDKQTININKENEIYEITLKILEYNNEQLFLSIKDEEQEFSNIFLDNCNLKGKNLLCKITKDKIEEILGYSGQMFKLYYIDINEGLVFNFDNVYDIIINYNLPQKEDIFIGITNLLQNNIGINDYISYETNVSDISNIISNKFIYKKNSDINIPCLMKKIEGINLLILCKIEHEGELSLGEIKKEINLNKINIKYNLLIQPVVNNDIFISKGKGGSILFAFPNILDFYINDSFIIHFYSKEINNIWGIKLYKEENNDLKCTNINNIKKCIVDINYFEGKELGNYFIYHKNYLNTDIRFYEINPFQVILPKKKETIIKINKSDNNNTFFIGTKGALSFLTDSKDSMNIFDPSDIEEKTLNNVTFTGYEKNYMASCYLWKPKGEKMKLICKFDEIVKDEYIILNKYSFEYNECIIVILFEDYVTISQLSENIASLYSDKQEINIVESNNEYNLIFKKLIYNKEPLLLYTESSVIKNLVLNCKEDKKELKCIIEINKLLEILAYSGEKFCLCHLSNSYGLLKFNDVLDITINYENVIKKDIYVNVTKLIDANKRTSLYPFVEKNSFFYFETNVTNFPRITSDYFEFFYNPNLKRRMKCLFKTNGNENNHILYLLCNCDSSSWYTIELSEEYNIFNANIQYNFKIVKNNKKFEYLIFSDEKASQVINVIPQTLDFTSQDQLIIKYIAWNPEKLEYIKLNNDSISELQCANKKTYKECLVPKNHFTKSGYYHTYHNNSYGAMFIFYEIPKINVIIEKNDYNSESSSSLGVIIGSIIGALVVIAIVAFFVVRYFRRKNGNLFEKDNKLDISLKPLSKEN